MVCHNLNLTCLAKSFPIENDKAPCSRRLKVALVGAGIFARKAHLPSLLEANDCFDLCAIWSRSRESAEAAALIAFEHESALTPVEHRKLQRSPPFATLWGDGGWSRLLSGDIGAEVLDIVLPIPSQVRYVQEGLSHGFSVISEKPVAPTSRQAEDMLAWIHRNRSLGRWFVAENWRFETPFRIGALAKEAGSIGDLLAFSAVSLGSIPVENVMVRAGSWRISEDSNWITDVAVHMVAGMRLVLGAEISVHGVSAKSVRQHPHVLRPFDTFSAALLSGDGQRSIPGTMLFSLASPRIRPKEVPGLSDLTLHVVGTNGSLVVTRGSVELRDADGLEVAKLSGLQSPSVALALRSVSLAIQLQGSFSQEASVRPVVAVPSSPEEALQDLRIVEAIIDASRSQSDAADDASVSNDAEL